MKLPSGLEGGGTVTTIRTTCPKCGEVDMGPEAIVLRVAPGEDDGSYRFTCPECAAPVEKPADRKVVVLLASAGVSQSTIEGPLFTIDDVVDFHFQLEDDAFLRQLMG